MASLFPIHAPGARWAQGASVAARVLIVGFGVGACKSRPVLPPLEGPAVVVVGRDAGAGSTAATAQEREPNDSRAAAQVVEVAPVGRTVLAGAIEARSGSAPGDIDRYLVRLTANDYASEAGGPYGGADAAAQAGAPALALLTAVLTHVPGSVERAPLVLELGRAHGSGPSVTLAADGEAVGLPNLVLSTALPVALAVRAVKGQSIATRTGYELALLVTPATGNEEREPNDVIAEATPIPVESATLEMVGHIGWPGDIDVFAVPAGQAVPGTGVEAEVELPPHVAASLELVGADGVPVVTGTQGRGQVRVAGPAPKTSAPLYVLVKASRAASFTRAYVLRVRLGLPLE